MPKPKLTPEERRELRKQKKAEKKLQKEEQKRQVKRDELSREVKYGELTIRRQEQNWRDMLTKIALPRMRTELEFAWHNFERVIDCKDFTISLLKDEILDAEEQHMRNFRVHLESVDKLIAFFNDRLEEFKEEYEMGVKRLQERCESDTANLKDVNSEHVDYLKTMLLCLENAKREQERDKRAEYYSILDENEVKDHFLLQKLKAHLESKYQNLFEDIKCFIQDYYKRMKERKKEYRMLKKADDAIQEEVMVKQFKKIKKLYDTLSFLRQKFKDMKQTESALLKDIQIERQFFFNSFIALKRKLAEDQQDDFFKMARLSEWCARVFNVLENLDKKGQNILTLAGICRKMETKREKILPFPVFQYKMEHDDLNKNNEPEEKMLLFWQRAGQVYTVFHELKQERQYLTEANELIIEVHNNYCEKLKYPAFVRKTASGLGINKVDGNAEMEKYRKGKRAYNREIVDYYDNLIVEKLKEY